MIVLHNKGLKVAVAALLVAIAAAESVCTQPADARRRRGGSSRSSSKGAKPPAAVAKPGAPITTKTAGGRVSTRWYVTSNGKGSSSSNSSSLKSNLENEREAVDRKRAEIHARIASARQKEKLAYAQLNVIKHQLHATEGTLKNNQKKLNNTVDQIHKTESVITQTQTAEMNHEQLAGSRLREIYEGHRLSFLEMAFQVDSLENLLDRMYYQERIAAIDKALIDQLRARKQALQDNKERLASEKNKLGDIVSEIAKKAMEIARLKGSQEEVAERLKSQRALFEQAERDLAIQSKSLEKQILAMETSQNSASSKPMQKGTGTMAMPLRAKVTSPFGWRTHPIFRRKKFHTGIDLAGPMRSPIRASDSGHVLFTGWYGGYGKVVIVSHGNNMSTLYAHLSSFAVSKGQNISKGDIVGYEGTTGFATGPHLHFEVRVEGKPHNPLNYVN
jgi:murein DD-endopeptidase MepM/ murein hydrolase activator NlpD